MVVVVSTKPRRLIAVFAIGTLVTIGLIVAARNTSGLVAPMLAVAALATAALTLSYLIAAITEGTIDRRQRRAMSRQLQHDTVTITDSQRCTHCHRPLVTAGDVSICANCDQ